MLSSKILIILIAGIGDMVLASKAIRTVRNGCPDAEIHLLTSTEAVPLAVNYPYIDYVHAFPIRELRKDKKYLFDVVRIIRNLRTMRFDQVINLYRVGSLSGAAKMGLLFSMFKANAKIGHDRYGFGLFLTKTVPAETFEGRHVVNAMMNIATSAGGIPDGKGIEVFWNARITSKWEDFFARPTGNIIVGINPGGDRENRRWAPERFASVAEKILERFNARIIILGGPADRDIASYIESRIHSDVSNLSGEIPLDELACVISKLDLLITNDSGPTHIAAATKTPLVALFGPEDPRLFGPYMAPELYRALHKDVPCRPCGKKKCTLPLCLDQITPDEVVAACIEMLQGKSSEKSVS
jgi:heptosyltransferase-2